MIRKAGPGSGSKTWADTFLNTSVWRPLAPRYKSAAWSRSRSRSRSWPGSWSGSWSRVFDESSSWKGDI